MSNRWTRLEDLGTKRRGAGGVVVNDHQFLVIGGDDSENRIVSKTCEYYDTTQKKWNGVPIPLEEGRIFFGVARVGDRVYVVGGRTGNYKTLDSLVSIDLSGGGLSALATTTTTRAWERLAPMKQKREEFACVSHGDCIYVFGGLDDKTDELDSAEWYDVKTNEWKDLPVLPGGGRYGCAAGVVGDKIYVVGGTRFGVEDLLKSTVVFDVSTQQWEPSSKSNDEAYASTVPDMSAKRYGLSVVVVDEFVLAIGGYSDGAKSIEVLDTARNAWKLAAAETTWSRFDSVAGFCQSTKELIVAGENTKSAESIDFYKKLLPPGFWSSQTEEQPQKISADEAQGEDRVGVKAIAVAIADVLVGKDLIPPWVVGVLGQWGMGKSYFSNLILDRIIEIQKKPWYTIESAYTGHIYKVEFNAWTFSEGNLWSSIMYKILKDLNTQLQLEERVGVTALEKGEVSTIELFHKFSNNELELLNEYEKFDEEFLRRIKKGDNASEILLKAINRDYKKCKDTETKIKEKQQSRRQEFESTLNWLARKILDDESLATYESIRKFKENVRWYHRLLPHKIGIYSIVFFVSLAIIAILLVVFVEELKGAYDWAMGVVTACSPIIGTITSYLSTTMKYAEEGRKMHEELKIWQSTDSFDDDDLDIEKSKEIRELKKLRNQQLQLRSQMLAVKGSSLRKTVSELVHSKKYEANLGIVHDVKEDLDRLSHAMLHNPNQKEIFPRGHPRILLIVDDLDRCPPAVVVKVIETLQLLVKTELFVAVLAIDPRYVCLSLEQHYEGILYRDTAPTGMDFLEKIVQIPFRLPRVVDDNLRRFLSAEFEPGVEGLQASTEANAAAAASTAAIAPSSEGNGIADNGIDSEDESKTTADNNPRGNADISDSGTAASTNAPSGGVADEENDGKEFNPNASGASGSGQSDSSVSVSDTSPELPSGDPGERPVKLEVSRGSVTEDEFDQMVEIFQLFQVDTRCIKRIANVYKVLSELWRRKDNGFIAADSKLKSATLFSMLLAANELTRDVTHRIYQWMDFPMVYYDYVMPAENLADLFEKQLRMRNSRYHTLMLYIRKYLENYTWNDLQGWKHVSSQFMLARSFSFFCYPRKSLEQSETETRSDSGHNNTRAGGTGSYSLNRPTSTSYGTF